MKDYTKWELPLYVDLVDKDNYKGKKDKEKTFENLFAAWPLRVVIIDNDFKIQWILHPSDKDGSFDFNQIKDSLSQLLASSKCNYI